MSEPAIQYPELSPELRGGLHWRMLKYFGAGAIIASVTIGSGETLFASRGGAIFGYTLLWCFVGGALMKGIQVYTAARYITLTGEHPMTHWGHLPGPRNWVPVVIGILSVLCFPFWLAGLPLMLGKTINWIIGIDPGQTPESEYDFLQISRGWGTLCIIVAITLTWIQSYNVLEKVQTFIVGLLLMSLMAACFISRPDWLAALAGMVPGVPHIDQWIVDKYPQIAMSGDYAKQVLAQNPELAQQPDYQFLLDNDFNVDKLDSSSSVLQSLKDAYAKMAKPPWVEVGVYLGAIGGGTYDYLGYIGCLREKAWGLIGMKRSDTNEDPHEIETIATSANTLPISTSRENIKRGRAWLRPAKIDVGIGFLCVLVFTICFVLLGAHILRPQQIIPEGHNLLTHQAKFLTQFGKGWLYIYQLGIFMAFWGTIYGAYEIYIRTTYECLRPLSQTFRQIPMKKLRAMVLAYCGIGGLTLMWIFPDPVKIVTPAAIVGVVASGFWCFAMVWVDRCFVPGPLRMGRILVTLTIISGLTMTALGAKSLWEYVAGLIS